MAADAAAPNNLIWSSQSSSFQEGRCTFVRVKRLCDGSCLLQNKLRIYIFFQLCQRLSGREGLYFSPHSGKGFKVLSCNGRGQWSDTPAAIKIMNTIGLISGKVWSTRLKTSKYPEKLNFALYNLELGQLLKIVIVYANYTR